MLLPARTKVFVTLSVFMHLAFALLFAEVTLSFPPPPIQKLSLMIITRGGGQGEIVQSEAGWPTPNRLEPGFSADRALKSLDADIPKWMEYAAPDPSIFTPRDALAPDIDIAELAAKAYEGAPGELFSHPPAESKPRPMAGLAIGPAVPEIFGSD